MPEIKFYNRAPVPMEMHKVKIVQKLTMLSAEERLNKLDEIFDYSQEGAEK